jgi:hypothetical protein
LVLLLSRLLSLAAVCRVRAAALSLARVSARSMKSPKLGPPRLLDGALDGAGGSATATGIRLMVMTVGPFNVVAFKARAGPVPGLSHKPLK